RPFLHEEHEPDLHDAHLAPEGERPRASFGESRVVEREGDATLGRHRQEQRGSPGWQLQSFLAGLGDSPPPPAAGARRFTRSACAFCASASLALSSARVFSSCAEATCCKRSFTFCCCSASCAWSFLASSACCTSAARVAASRASFSFDLLTKKKMPPMRMTAAPRPPKVTMRWSFFLCSSCWSVES